MMTGDHFLAIMLGVFIGIVGVCAIGWTVDCFRDRREADKENEKEMNWEMKHENFNVADKD